ncbi:MAG: hypothetical protein ABJG78_07910 [Cyclobacteriaceae bacterium]
MKRYLIISAVVSALLLLLYFSMNNLFFGGYLHDKFPTLIIFFFLQSFPIAWLLIQAEKNPANFPMFAIASIGFRLLTGLFLLLIFYFLKVEDIIPFSFQFLAVYLVYFVFELIVVLANLRRN